LLLQAYEYAQKALQLAQQSSNLQDAIAELEELLQLSKAHLPTDYQ